MMARTRTTARLGAFVTIGLLALAGCGRLNRTATINQVTTTPGPTTAAALQQQLAAHGLSGAQVTCAKTLIVNVGTTSSCTMSSPDKTGSVRFTFSSSHGTIDPASVKPSS